VYKSKAQENSTIISQVYKRGATITRKHAAIYIQVKPPAPELTRLIDGVLQ
jgi:hypothetical protein